MSKNLSDFVEIENDFVDREIDKMVQFQMLSEVQLGQISWYNSNVRKTSSYKLDGMAQ